VLGAAALSEEESPGCLCDGVLHGLVAVELVGAYPEAKIPRHEPIRGVEAPRTCIVGAVWSGKNNPGMGNSAHQSTGRGTLRRRCDKLPT